MAVDDDSLVLTNTVAMLEDLGHTALAASSAMEALDIIRENAVDLVITDQAMPQMTGLQLVDAIHREWPALAVILAAGFAETAPGEGAGLRKLAKPFTQHELAVQVAAAQAKMKSSARVVRLFADRSGGG